MRSSFAYAGISEEKGKSLWSKCASTIVHVENIITKKKGEKCAYEKLKNKMPAYAKNLRTFGEMAVVKDNGSMMKGKLKNRGIVAMFVGYSEKHASKVYRFLKLDTNRIILSRDVTWLNKMYGDYNQNEEESELEIEIDMDEELDKVKKISMRRNQSPNYQEKFVISKRHIMMRRKFMQMKTKSLLVVPLQVKKWKIILKNHNHFKKHGTIQIQRTGKDKETPSEKNSLI